MNSYKTEIYLLLNTIRRNYIFQTIFLVTVYYDRRMHHCNGPKIKA